eukprot:6466248-Amphidinium_carterae.2
MAQKSLGGNAERGAARINLIPGLAKGGCIHTFVFLIWGLLCPPAVCFNFGNLFTEERRISSQTSFEHAGSGVSKCLSTGSRSRLPVCGRRDRTCPIICKIFWQRSAMRVVFALDVRRWCRKGAMREAGKSNKKDGRWISICHQLPGGIGIRLVYCSGRAAGTSCDNRIFSQNEHLTCQYLSPDLVCKQQGIVFYPVIFEAHSGAFSRIARCKK